MGEKGVQDMSGDHIYEDNYNTPFSVPPPMSHLIALHLKLESFAASKTVNNKE